MCSWGDTEDHLSKLEQVLFAVDDLEAAALNPAAHIARMQPAVTVYCLPCVLLILPVPLENCGAPHTDLHISSAASLYEILYYLKRVLC